MSLSNIKQAHKLASWFAAYPNKLLLDGQIVWLKDNSGTFKKGDGVTALSALPFLGGVTTTPNLAQVLAVGNAMAVGQSITSPNGAAFAQISDASNTISNDNINILQAPVNQFNATNNNFPQEIASQIAYLDATKNLKTLPVATYPSLAELAFVKGLTSSAQTQISANVTAIATKENISNKVTDLTTNDNTHYPTTAAVQNAINNSVIGLADYRGAYDCSSNVFPTTGGSGLAGAVVKGDFWRCSVGGTLGGTVLTAGDLIIALVDTPAQTSTNWDLIEHALSYVPEDVVNKSSSYTVSSITTYANTKALVDGLATKQAVGTYASGTGSASGTNTGDETGARLASLGHTATVKSVLVDADELTGQDSATAFSYIRTTLLNIFTYIQKKFETKTNGGDAAYSILAGDNVIVTNVAFTLPRIWTLPSAASVNAGNEKIINDAIGTLTNTNTLTIAVQTGQYLNNVLNGTEVMTSANAHRRLISDGVNNWTFDAGIVRLGATQTLTNKKLLLSAGTTAANTAPIKLTSGALMTTAEVGAIEFLTDKFYATITTGAARKTFAFLESPSFTGTVIVASNTYMNGAKISVNADIVGGYNSSKLGKVSVRAGSNTDNMFFVEDAQGSNPITCLAISGNGISATVTSYYSLQTHASAVTGNFTGTSLAIARTFAHYYSASSTSQTTPLDATGTGVDVAANHISICGVTGTNAGTRLDSVGLRVGTLADVHTANTVAFEVGGISKFGGVVRLKNYTVATLPVGVQGDVAYVTDALNPTYNTIVAGGGAVVIRVFYNGTAWMS